MRDYEDTFNYNFIEAYMCYSGEDVEWMGDVVKFDYRGGGAGQSYSEFRYFKLDLTSLYNILDYYGDDEFYITRDFETLNYFIGALYSMFDDDIVWFSDDTKVLIENIDKDLKYISSYLDTLQDDLRCIANIEVGEMALGLVDDDCLNKYFTGYSHMELERLGKNLKQVVEELNKIIEFEEFEDEEEDEEV